MQTITYTKNNDETEENPKNTDNKGPQAKRILIKNEALILILVWEEKACAKSSFRKKKLIKLLNKLMKFMMKTSTKKIIFKWVTEKLYYKLLQTLI